MKIWSRLVASLYDHIMKKSERNTFSFIRKDLIEPLKGDILEIGCGTGINFQYYSSKTKVLAIEPGQFMYERAFKRLETHSILADISLHPIGIEEVETIIPSSELQFDAIVCTLVLCSIPDLEKTIDDFKHWLKPNGQLIILEHIQSKTSWKAAVLNYATPMWKRVAEGCHLNRNTDELLKKKGFKPLEERHFNHGLPFVVGKYTINMSHSNFV